ETATLAGYVADLKFEEIPHHVRERAKALTLDFLGSTIRARRDAESTPSLLNMLDALALDATGPAIVFGGDRTWTPAVAALLTGYVADLKFEDIPHDVRERAKALTLDDLGSAIRARRDAESTPSLLKMLEALALDATGPVTVFGDDRTWTPAVAALLNGALGY